MCKRPAGSRNRIAAEEHQLQNFHSTPSRAVRGASTPKGTRVRKAGPLRSDSRVLLLALRMLNTSRPEPSEARQTRAAAAKAVETEAAIVRSHSRGEHLVGVFGVQSHSNLRQ